MEIAASEGLWIRAWAESAGTTPTIAHVLVIDNDAGVQQMIASYFRDNDIRVTTLGDVRLLDQVLAREAIDLLMLELSLPGQDGIQTVRRLRESRDAPIDRAIDVQILRLRRKIQSDTAQRRLIQTERSAGDSFAAPVQVVR